MILFNEYTHKLLYEFFIEELDVEQNEMNDELYVNEEGVNTSTQTKRCE